MTYPGPWPANYSFSLSLSLQLQHGMNVYGVVVAENMAGLQSAFYSKPILIDWSAPVIQDIHLQLVETAPDLFDIAATWVVTDQESVVQECFWTLGKLQEFTF